MVHAYEVRMRFGVSGTLVYASDLRRKFCYMWIEYLFCFGEMSFCLCKFRNSGKFGDYLVDSVLKIEKVKFVRILGGWGGGTRHNGLHGDAPPQRGTFFRLQVYDRLRI